MKKKIYVAPAVEVFQLSASSMIATSNPEGGFDGSGDGTDSPELAPGQRPVGGAWDGMWN